MAQTQDNPFMHRWKLDDPQWVKRRKQQWEYVRQNYVADFSAKALKNVKEFFLEGTIRMETKEGIQVSSVAERTRFVFTPSESVSEVMEVFESLRPSSYYTALNSASFGFTAALNNPFGELGGCEELFAKALFPDDYREESVRVIEGRERGDYKKYIPAEEFIPRFEFESYRFLTETDSSPYNPVQFILEHYPQLSD